ncbi:MAG: lysylphosphatidylglycerol synthase transmembrane domain-containing protein [Patescibacteria group bacterium]|nr:lysylphosphatidylglycerol synthase transmembrane domain-containing protein [Patescibacteria group bacterium]
MKKTIIKVIVSVGLFFLLSRLVDFGELWQTIATANLAFFLLGAAVVAFNYFIGAVRWSVLLEEDSPSFLTLLKFYYLGGFFNNFMPSSVGGDAYKMYRLGKELGDGVQGIAATFMDRFVGLFALFCLSSFGLISFLGIRGLGVFLAFLVLAAIGLWFLKFASPWHPKIAEFQGLIYAYQNKYRVLLKAFLLSFGVQLCSVGAQLLAFRALDLYPPLGKAFFVLPLINFIAFLPISFNGLGVQDILFSRAFPLLGVAGESAVAASLVYHAMRFVISLVGGLIYALEAFGNGTPPPKEVEESVSTSSRV